jgi:tripartite-type tricarboxylate transporter receptor subunit TctC
MRKLLQGAAWAVWALALCVTAAHAQADYPSRPIKMYVPFPGGGIDVTARIAAEKLSEILGQQIAIINQGGGGGAIATDAVVRADPDGYTLLYHSVTGITHAAVTQDLSYDWLRDLAPVSLIARFAPVMIVSPTLPVQTMADFIALLKANPGKYSYGSSGTGTAVHLATELFKQKAQVDIVHVPYRGTVAVLPDLISGRVVMMIDGVPAETKNIQNGVVRALEVTTATRSPSIPTCRPCAKSAWTTRCRSGPDSMRRSAPRRRSSTSFRPRPTKPCTMPALPSGWAISAPKRSARLRPSSTRPPAGSSRFIGRSCGTIRRCSAGNNAPPHAVFCTFRPSSAIVSSRMMNFWILPVTVIGNASTNLT